MNQNLASIWSAQCSKVDQRLGRRAAYHVVTMVTTLILLILLGLYLSFKAVLFIYNEGGNDGLEMFCFCLCWLIWPATVVAIGMLGSELLSRLGLWEEAMWLWHRL